MSEEGETPGLHDDESSSLEAPPAIEVKAAPWSRSQWNPKRNAKKQRVEIDRPLVPVLMLLFLTNSSLFSAGAWDFNRRVEALYSDGVFRFDADPKTSHGIEESVYIIFIDPSYTSYSQVYRREIHIGSTWEYEREPYNEHCEVESVNTVECIISNKMEMAIWSLRNLVNTTSSTTPPNLCSTAKPTNPLLCALIIRSGNALLRRWSSLATKR